MSTKVVSKLMPLLLLLGLLLMLSNAATAQRGTQDPERPRPGSVFKSSRTTTVAPLNGDPAVTLKNRDVTKYRNGYGPNPDMEVQAVVRSLKNRASKRSRFQAPTVQSSQQDGYLIGVTYIDIHWDTDIHARGWSKLSQDVPNTRKIVSWTHRVNVNGEVDLNAVSNAGYTNTAALTVYSPSKTPWSGCVEFDNGTDRYASVQTGHFLSKKDYSGTWFPWARSFYQSAEVRYSCS